MGKTGKKTLKPRNLEQGQKGKRIGQRVSEASNRVTNKT